MAWYKGSAENANDWQLLVNVLNHAAAVCAKEGIEVAYHNHDQEFKISLHGRTAMEWLYDGDGLGILRQVNETSRFSPLVKQELDIGWCVLAGGDPLAWLAAHPRRNPTVHVMPAGGRSVGDANDRADWKRIIPALVADGVEWLVVKPVARPDSLADLKASIDYLRRLHLRK